MADRTKEQGGNGRYSAFYSLEDAEWAVQYALDHLGNALEKIAPDSPPISFIVDTGQAIGYGYQSGNPNRVDSITRIAVVVVIETNSQVSVTTAYPTLDRYQPPPPSGNVNRLIELNEM